MAVFFKGGKKADLGRERGRGGSEGVNKAKVPKDERD